MVTSLSHLCLIGLENKVNMSFVVTSLLTLVKKNVEIGEKMAGACLRFSG